MILSDTGLTTFVVMHFQGLWQQSLLVSLSKTPWVLSLIGHLAVGKYHGNSAGKSWPLLLQQTYSHNAQTHTLLLLLEFPTRIRWLTYCIPNGLRASLVRTEQQSKQSQVELYYQPLNTSSRNSHNSSKIPLVDSRSCKIKKGFRAVGTLWLPLCLESLKLFTVDTKNKILLLVAKLKF